jgi:WD40 repeat protein
VVRVWEITTGKLVNQIITGEGEIVAIDFFPDNRRIAIGGSSGNVLIADFQTAQELVRLPTTTAPIYSIDVNDQGTAVAAVTTTGITYYWTGSSLTSPIEK